MPGEDISWREHNQSSRRHTQLVPAFMRDQRQNSSGVARPQTPLCAPSLNEAMCSKQERMEARFEMSAF